MGCALAFCGHCFCVLHFNRLLTHYQCPQAHPSSDRSYVPVCVHPASVQVSRSSGCFPQLCILATTYNMSTRPTCNELVGRLLDLQLRSPTNVDVQPPCLLIVYRAIHTCHANSTSQTICAAKKRVFWADNLFVRPNFTKTLALRRRAPGEKTIFGP